MTLLERDAPAGEPYETQLMAEDEAALSVRVVERKTGSASTYRLRRDMFASDDYRSFVRVHGELRELCGTPPFSVALGKKEDEALSFEDLRTAPSSTWRVRASACSASRASAR